jgi:hypothetical protein
MADNLYGGASVQIYPGGEATLSTPHSDVKAFLDYVGQFNSVNFHAMDDDVREWRYDQEFDNWQDRLGMDSVKVLYHHGHSGMAADGRFVAGIGIDHVSAAGSESYDPAQYLEADETGLACCFPRLRYGRLEASEN